MGLKCNLSSLSAPNYATSYSLNSIGMVNGSLSYLYSSLRLQPQVASSKINLHDFIHGYRQLQELDIPDAGALGEEWQAGRRVDHKPTLLYGRLYLPQSTLEALYMRRLTPTQLLKISVVSDHRLRNGGTLLALHQYDTGKFNVESLYSTDGGLVGFRGLYNFGIDLKSGDTQLSTERNKVEDRFYGRFSAGAEIYYGALNKSGGMSIGGRFATLPLHKGIPLTATLTLNPLMGNFSATYAVKAGEHLSLSSRFDFNAYSYESESVLGFELWKMKRKFAKRKERSTAAKMAWRLDGDEGSLVAAEDEVAGVLKMRMDQNYKLAVLWEGRIKDLLFTMGSTFDIRTRDQPFKTLGLELQFSS